MLEKTEGANQEWTIQRNEKKKKCVGHHYYIYYPMYAPRDF